MTDWFKHPLILEGEKVKLIPLETEHFESLIEIGKDKRIWEFMPVDWLEKKDLRAVLTEALDQRTAGTQYPFVVIDKVNGKIVGSTRYLRISKEFRNLEIGWTWYAPEYWGKKFNKECKFLLLKHCFENLGTISVHLGTADTNPRSQRAIEGIGATLEGIFRNRLVHKGEKKSFLVYSIIDEEWAAVKARLCNSLGISAK